jgi:hypothetical protein
VARRPNKVDKLKADLAGLHASISEELRVPSLAQNQLAGFAALFVMVLPMLSSEGRSIFTDDLLQLLIRCFNQRFGGCLIPSARTHPPFWGLWNPAGSAGHSERDYVTTIQIFANPIEPTNRFFGRLKQILKTAGIIEQQEILVARFDCWLI